MKLKFKTKIENTIMTYDLQQRIFFVKSYYEKKSIVAVQRAFKAKYQLQVTPSRTSI